MYGVVTRNAEEARWPDFDLAFYEVKDVSGRSAEPIPEAVSMISCFGDNAAAEEQPDLVDKPRRATRHPRSDLLRLGVHLPDARRISRGVTGDRRRLRGGEPGRSARRHRLSAR